MNRTVIDSKGKPDRHLLVPLILAAVMVIIQLVTAQNYGIFRDEMYFIACGDNLDFGYVDHPPMIAIVARLSTTFFGNSLLGLRLWPALAAALTVLLAAMIARELGGERFAQGFASLSVFAAVEFLGIFGTLTIPSLEILIWTFNLFVLLKILNGASPRLWLLFGLVAGLGLQTKLTGLVFGFAVVLALVLTRHRRHFATPWLYLGGAIAALVFLPNIIWQIAHGWPTLEFVRNAMEYKNLPLSPLEFLGQMILTLNPLTLPLWVGGLVYLLFSKTASNCRPLGWFFLIAMVILILQRSKYYYLDPVVPLMLAAGAVAFERLVRKTGWGWLKPVYAVVLIVTGAILAPLAIPVLPPESFVSYSQILGFSEVKTERHEQAALPQYFADRFGWKELAGEIADAYNALPQMERERCAIITSNYGEAGAVEYFGSRLGLPQPISGHNSYWLWGPREFDGEVAICFGFREEGLGSMFKEVEIAAIHRHPFAMLYESNRPILVCRGLKTPVEKLWQLIKSFN
ncbi:MAG TPA: glycosyltransferase family 39 protein [Acidobacteriota bacterium]|nr:glycosyltransferase family 39 protein [Acidobacteriota bacterium]